MLSDGFNHTSVIGCNVRCAAVNYPMYYLLHVPMEYHKESSCDPYFSSFIFMTCLLNCQTLSTGISIYADDTVLYCYSPNAKDLENMLNEDLLKMANWLNENKLKYTKSRKDYM